jgi:cytoskeleton protein RodZ
VAEESVVDTLSAPELAPRRRQWTAADADASNSAFTFQGRRNFSSNAAPRNERAVETSLAQIESAEPTPATEATPSTEIVVAKLLPASEPETADDSTESVQLAAARRVSELTNGNRASSGVVRSFPVPPPIPQGNQTAALSGAGEYVPQVFGANNEGSRVIIEAKLESWVQVRGRSGETLLTRILRVGDKYLVPDRPNLLMMTGNAAALRIMVDGEEIGPLGPPGAILRDVALEPSQLLARASSR